MLKSLLEEYGLPNPRRSYRAISNRSSIFDFIRPRTSDSASGAALIASISSLAEMISFCSLSSFARAGAPGKSSTFESTFISLPPLTRAPSGRKFTDDPPLPRQALEKISQRRRLSVDFAQLRATLFEQFGQLAMPLLELEEFLCMRLLIAPRR